MSNNNVINDTITDKKPNKEESPKPLSKEFIDYCSCITFYNESTYDWYKKTYGNNTK